MGRRGRRGGPYGVGADEGYGPDGPVRRPDPRVTWLEGRADVRAAGLVAETFSLDPAEVLADLITDEPRREFKALIRLAAHNVVLNEHAKAERKANRTTK